MTPLMVFLLGVVLFVYVALGLALTTGGRVATEDDESSSP
jgi:hypothetical protein